MIIFAVEKRTSKTMKETVTTDIFYIGQDDADQHLFESQYVTPEGMCYNSYVIVDEKVAVMDTSDARTLEGWERDLSDVLQGRLPDYLVVHHLEPDHATGIGRAMAAYPGMTLVCSERAAQMLPLYFEGEVDAERIRTVKDGDTLELGNHTLQFVMAPMVHWPEVMVSYDRLSKVLFSADAFGKFGVRDSEPDDWACEARRYYFNICGKYGAPVSKLLKTLSTLEVEQILPLHGPLLSGEMMAEAVRLYNIWAAYGVESEGVMVAHASIHGCTAQAAQRLKEMLLKKGCPKVALCDLTREDQAEAIEDAFRYGKVVLCASSYDGGLFPPMHDFLHHLQIKAWQGRHVALVENGSWAPSAARTMKAMLEEMKNITLVGDTVTLRGRMKQADEAALEQLAEAILA